MTVKYIIKIRERPIVLSKRWFVVWIKRLITMPGLLNVIRRKLMYEMKGVGVGELTVLCRFEINGPPNNIVIGESSFIGTDVNMASHGQILIGNNVVINSNVQILTASHDTSHPNWIMFSKKIEIKDYAWLAYNSILLPGVTIGKGAVVGAGSVVVKDVPDYSVVAGNPAKIIGQRTHELNYSPVNFISPYEAWIGKS